MESRRYLLVTSKALAGREEEYTSWYINRHLKDVLAVPGFISGQFFRSVGPRGKETGEYNALYEIESSEPSTIMGALMARRDEMVTSDALDTASVRFTFLCPV